MNEKKENIVSKSVKSIDWPLVFTLIVTAILLAVFVVMAKRSNIAMLKSVAANV